MQEQYADRLKSDVVGLLGAATLGVVMLSPAMTLYGGFGPTFLAAGRAAPLAFVWALLATLPTVLSYVLLSREYPLSGSTASWINLAAPHPLAVWAGWIVFLYYLTNFVIQPVTLGVFAGDVIALFGISPNKLTYFAGVVICCVWPAWIVYWAFLFQPRAHWCFCSLKAPSCSPCALLSSGLRPVWVLTRLASKDFLCKQRLEERAPFSGP